MASFGSKLNLASGGGDNRTDFTEVISQTPKFFALLNSVYSKLSPTEQTSSFPGMSDISRVDLNENEKLSEYGEGLSKIVPYSEIETYEGVGGPYLYAEIVKTTIKSIYPSFSEDQYSRVYSELTELIRYDSSIGELNILFPRNHSSAIAA